MSAAIPPMDPRPLRTIVDMGMGNMAGMNMGGTGKMSCMDKMSGIEMSGIEMSGMDLSNMTGMKMEHALGLAKAQEFAKGAQLTGIDAPGQPGPRTSAKIMEPDMGGMKAPLSENVQLRPGPGIDNIAEMPTERLSRAGEGLPARRVLAYSDLRAIYRGTDPRPLSREIELHLTGNMERFIRGFNGAKFSDAQPIRLKLGERVRIILVNDSMMEHPIHLHGPWSELENGNGEFRPYKHTINVKTGERLSYLVSADARSVGLPLPSALPHGGRYVSRRDRVMSTQTFFSPLRGTFVAAAISLTLWAGSLASSGSQSPGTPAYSSENRRSWTTRSFTICCSMSSKAVLMGPTTNFAWMGRAGSAPT
jgi:FtsP/CotA-like multicopper oxidase with cupredoxin domain